MASPAQTIQRCRDVRGIDFKNLVYPLSEPRFTNGRVLQLRVIDGRYEEPHRQGYQGFLYLDIADVAYGDLTGDAIDAAVVAKYGSNSGNFHVTDTYVFRCFRERPTLVGVLTQDQIQRDSGTEVLTATDHPMTINGNLLEMTYETPRLSASPTTFRYKLVGSRWQRQDSR
jgi:hypothetical protein